MNTTQNLNSSQNKNNMSFANVTKNKGTTFPKKEQGIVINPIEEINPDEYVYTIGDIIGAQNITHTCRKNKKIHIFLKEKEYVDTLINNHKTIIVQNQKIELRRFINPALRLIISNACPTIPHFIIEKTLLNQGLKLVSPITFLHAGFSREEYRHIMSSRRHVFINEDEETFIPHRIQIDYEETNYMVYLSIDVTCSTCKQKGHKANICPNQNREENEPMANQPLDAPCSSGENIDVISKESQLTPPLTNTKPENSETNKRTITQILTSDQSDTQDTDEPPQEQNNSARQKNQRQPKKPRALSPGQQLTVEQATTHLKQIIQQTPNKYPLTVEEVKDFLENALGSSDPLNISMDYTEDPKKLIEMLQDIKSQSNRTLKSKLARMINKMNEQIDNLEDTDENSN